MLLCLGEAVPSASKDIRCPGRRLQQRPLRDSRAHAGKLLSLFPGEVHTATQRQQPQCQHAIIEPAIPAQVMPVLVRYRTLVCRQQTFGLLVCQPMVLDDGGQIEARIADGCILPVDQVQALGIQNIRTVKSL